MPRLRRHLPPLLLLLPVIFICGKLMFSEGGNGNEDITPLIPPEAREQFQNSWSIDLGWPWPFRRHVRDQDRVTGVITEVATHYYVGAFLLDFAVWMLPIAAAAWLLARHRRRSGAWLRFSLRTMLIFVCLVGALLGLWLKEYRQWQQEQRVITRFGFSFNTFDDYKCPELLGRLWFDSAGPQFLHHPTSLWLGESHGYGNAETRAEKVEAVRTALAEMPDIKELEIDGFIVLELQDSRLFSKIESLGLIVEEENEKADEMVKIVGGWKQLKHLRIRGHDLPNEELAYLSGLTNLEQLLIRFEEYVTDEGIAHLRPLKRLRNLHLDRATITERSLDVVADLPALEIFDVGQIDRTQFTNAGFSKLARLTRLKQLDVAGSSATKGVTAFFVNNKQLEEINLWGLGVDDSDFEHLAKLPDLKKLTLSNTRVKGVGFEQMSSLKTLQTLYFSNTKIGDETLRAIGRCEALDELWIDDCQQITDAGIAHLVQLPRLRSLTLSNTQITDRALQLLARLPALEALSLDGCKALTDEGVMALAAAPKLWWVRLPARPQISDATVERLKKKIKNPHHSKF